MVPLTKTSWVPTPKKPLCQALCFSREVQTSNTCPNTSKNCPKQTKREIEKGSMQVIQASCVRFRRRRVRFKRWRVRFKRRRVRFSRYASISVGNASLTKLVRVFVVLLGKKRRFAVLGGSATPMRDSCN